MAGSPKWKLYTAGGEYKASTNDVSLFAACIGVLGEGATIRYEHSMVVWTEGSEGQPAFESYDYCSEICHSRTNSSRFNPGYLRAVAAGQA